MDPTNTNPGHRADRFAESGHRAVDQMADKLRSAEDKLSYASDEVRDRSERSIRQVRSYFEEHPLTSLGIAFASGIILSALLRK